MRNRSNVDNLTPQRLQALRRALAIMYALPCGDPRSFAALTAAHHGSRPTWCIDGALGFLTWHRASLVNFERALRSVDARVELPYWDWSSTPSSGVPVSCAAATYVDQVGRIVCNPLSGGPLPGSSANGSDSAGPVTDIRYTSRAPDLGVTSFGRLGEMARTACDIPEFAAFQTHLKTISDHVLCEVGGNMARVSTARFDPLFYLHFANVDRLWTVWQSRFGLTVPADEAMLELEPFTAPATEAFLTGLDLASARRWGYAYDDCREGAVQERCIGGDATNRVVAILPEVESGASGLVSGSTEHQVTVLRRAETNPQSAEPISA